MVSGVLDTSFTEWYSTFYRGIGKCIVLLGHHQEVLGIFSEDTTSPSKLQPLVANTQLDFTWRNYQSARWYRYRHFHYFFPGSYLAKSKSTSKNRRFRLSNMPKAMKKSVREQSPPPSEDHNSTDSAEASDSDHHQDPDVSFCLMVPPNQVPAMFMPYIEGPKMNWTVDDGLYHRFLKWWLKCKTILNCKLTNLPTKQKCQKIIAWSGDFGMDLYV